MTESASRSGFTLVELSVVIVIIGLIAAAILVGSEMLYAAQIRKVIAQAQELKTATHTFKLKYVQFPGDFDSASTLWPDDAPIDGNGNGVIECYDNGGTIYDCYNALHHLQLANMVWGVYTPVDNITSFPVPDTLEAAAPAALEQAYIAISYGNTWTSNQLSHHLTISALKHPVADIDFLIYLLTTYGTSTPIGILGKHAQAIDAKIDDGLPFSGVVMSRTPQLGGSEQLSCTLTDGSNMYNINSPYFTCALWLPIEK